MSAAMPPQPKPRPVADPDQLAALTDELARLSGGDPAELRFGVAVSGGPDSIALLLLMRGLSLGGLEAATVDHGLRPEAAAEAEDVAQLCASLAIPHATLRSATGVRGSIQAGARALRYALLEEWRDEHRLDFILTAHHADDQAETLLMRLNRASGVAGLAGIRERNRTVLRPLLAWRHTELLAICDAAEIKAVDDPSNRDMRFERVRMRGQLADATWLDAPALARSATLLDQADAALDWAVAHMISRWPDCSDPSVIRGDPWPDEIGWRILRVRLRAFNGSQNADQGQLLNAIAALRAKRKVSLGSITITPDRKDPSIWRIALAPPRRA
jgi:tRNA(Ile)-lysidine synthase